MRPNTVLAALLALLAGTPTPLPMQRNRRGFRPGMKITSPIFGEMSGKIGGAVASKARGGIQYLRKLVIPSNPQSSFQTAVRNIVSGLASYWRSTLSGANRTAWEALAASSSPEISGENLFVGNNTQVMLGGQPRIDVAPASASTTLTAPTVVVDVSDVEVQLTGLAADAWNAEGGGVNIYATAPQSASRLARQFPYRKIGTAEGAVSPIATFDAAYPAALGTLVAGKIVYVRLVAFSPTGQVSTQQTYRVTVQA